MTSHISYQENNVGKQEKFKDIKWVIINNKLRIGNTNGKIGRKSEQLSARTRRKTKYQTTRNLLKFGSLFIECYENAQ